MDSLNDAVSWYQQRIGTYDKQHWEKSVEQQVLKNIQHVPKKTTKVKAELIDVDLVRGSTFSKAKPQHGWTGVAKHGLLRVLFLPLYFRWWQKKTSTGFWMCLMCLYVLQVVATAVYITETGQHFTDETLSVTHLSSPFILMVILGTVHSQIVSTHVSYKQKRSQPREKRKDIKNRRKKTRARYRGSVHSDQESATPENNGNDHYSQTQIRKRRSRSKSSKSQLNHGVKFDERLVSSMKQKLKNYDREDSRDTEEESGMKISTDNIPIMKPKLVNKNLWMSRNGNMGSDQDKQGSVASNTSSTVDSVDDILPLHMSYKSLDGSEDITCNSYEDPKSLNKPITEYDGDILVADTDEFNDNNDMSVPVIPMQDLPLTDDSDHSDKTDLGDSLPNGRDLSRDGEFPYIPSDQEPEEGQIDLLGIKNRKQIGQKTVRKQHIASNTVDDLTQEVSGHPESVAVPDPVIDLNNLTDSASSAQLRAGIEADVDEYTTNGHKEDSLSEDMLGSSQNYIPLDPLSDCGKIDLLGIKKRHLVGRIDSSMRCPDGATSPEDDCACLTNNRTGRGQRTLKHMLANKRQENKESTGVSSCESDVDDTTSPNTPCYSRSKKSFPPGDDEECPSTDVSNLCCC